MNKYKFIKYDGGVFYFIDSEGKEIQARKGRECGISFKGGNTYELEINEGPDGTLWANKGTLIAEADKPKRSNYEDRNQIIVAQTAQKNAATIMAALIQAGKVDSYNQAVSDCLDLAKLLEDDILNRYVE